MRRADGFVLAEILLALAIFALTATILIGALLFGYQGTRLSGDRTRAAQLASEATEAVRNIANPNYSNLSAYTNGTTYYLTTTSGQWQVTTTPQTIGIYTRTLVFGDGPNGSRSLAVTVTWRQNAQRNGSLAVTTYYSNWRQPTAPLNKTGVFVYADGGTTTDRLSYKLLQSNGTWSAALAMPDIDVPTSNRVARSVKLYSAQSGTTKAILSRHYNGTTQYIYGTIWNGTTWNTPQLLGQFNSSSSLDVGNYGGDFLANGTFVVVYSDDTNVPKFRTFNGASWSAQGSLPQMGSSSNRVVNMLVKARPNSNEAMFATIASNSDVESSYFSSGTWSSYTQHTATSASNSSKIVDFTWSYVDNTKGMILYTNVAGDRSLRARKFTANGTGSGSWASMITSSTQPSGSIVHSVGITSRHNTAVEFIACDKDDQTAPHIYCYKILSDGSGFSNVTNSLITASTDPGGQRSFDLDYEDVSTEFGLIAYSDNTNSGKLKRYLGGINAWDATPQISLPNAAGTIQKTRIVSKPNSPDAMIVVADGSKNLSSVMFNGTTNALYATPSGQAWTPHTTNGPSNNAVWFDFAWDN